MWLAHAVPWQPFVAALAAPVAIWVLWRIQTSSVELLRLALLMLRDGHRRVYHVVSWLGTFIHELSHASVLLLSGHGVKQFRARSEQGHVLPARMPTGGLGLLSFLTAALAPLFVPPFFVLAALALAVDHKFVQFLTASGDLAGAQTLALALFVDFPTRLGRAALDLDLLRWPHALVVLLLLVAIPGARPSHVKGSRFHGTQDEGDVAVLRRLVRHNPWPLLAFLAVLYGAYLALVAFAPVPAAPLWYWAPVEAVAMLAVTGILLALFGTLWWGAAGLSGRPGRWVTWLCPVAFLACDLGARLVLHAAPAQANLMGLAAWLAVGLLARLTTRAPRIPTR